jgi:hypothetical protein
MRIIVAMAAAVGLATTASAQTAPDVKGVWSGPFRTVIWGENVHHPGQAATAAPRVREIAFSLEVEGQDGALLWGKSWSSPDRKEPFAAIVSADGKTIVGADTDGSLTAMIAGSDQLELCYTHTGLGPSKSIVASCGTLRRSR